jgi:hypothetical protein
MKHSSFERLAGAAGIAVGAEGFVYAVLFAHIVAGAPRRVIEL